MKEVNPDSSANAIMQYSFLHAFANDGTIDANELAFIEKLALKDGTVDDQERQVLADIFGRLSTTDTAPEVLEEIQHFCHQFQIQI